MDKHITAKVTDIVGTHIYNSDGEHCGCIQEIVVNKIAGDVAYLVLSYPGHFEPSYREKYFAVPFSAFQNKTIENREHNYLLEVDEDFLRNAPGFHKSNWPDFGDARFITEHKDYYKAFQVDFAA
tara:strand:+ start:1338 stop:1712 length:375 start_codon:yes stop_codon:yes gene_type:complete